MTSSMPLRPKHSEILSETQNTRDSECGSLLWGAVCVKSGLHTYIYK